MDNNKIFDPKWDFVFKNIFGKDEQIFIDFINSIFEDKNEKKVKEVHFENNEIIKNSLYDKESRLDVYAILDDETHVNIEIQIRDEDGFDKRTLYYWSKLYEGQIEKGDDYLKLQKSICINIVNFNIIQNERCHNIYGVTNLEDNDRFLTDFEVHFLELPKLKEKSYTDMTKLEKWLLFLKAPTEKIIEELCMQEPIIGKAMKTLKYVSQDPEARAIYEARMKYQLDFNTAIHSKQRRIARNMKAKNLPIDMIAEVTELPREEIEKL